MLDDKQLSSITGPLVGESFQNDFDSSFSWHWPGFSIIFSKEKSHNLGGNSSKATTGRVGEWNWWLRGCTGFRWPFWLHLSQLDAFASFATILHHSYPLTWNLEQLRHPLVGLGRWIGIAAPGSEVQKAQGITDSGASQTIGVGWCFKGNGNSIPALCQYHQKCL